MKIKEFLLKSLKKIYYLTKYLTPKDFKLQGDQYLGYVKYFNQSANDYIDNVLSSGKPCMISKFGTIELKYIVNSLYEHKSKYKLRDYLLYIKGEVNLFPQNTLSGLCTNAGFFPDDVNLLQKFRNIYLDAAKQIDVLGSYQYKEIFLKEYLKNAIFVNLDGYYAPYYYKNPWTRNLKGKRVLVIHPFSEDISSQYQKRESLFKDKNVLPDFTLITYKSVQSMLGIETGFSNWFEALEKMESDIIKIDFDIAIIGCGAYGMPLAAFCKKLGKQAIHLAGWTQILFGIKGTRWDNNKRVVEFYNNYWIRPSEVNRPKNANKVENACYW